ncbi:unnamed protein product [Clonostachys chloroleuca]|uniref:Uncharacterized protein n=1 Tax=Clonostachys chloroleuca TaxID=1926264 RepID=A0AA35PXC8_9HYPO|nr:unnamed protein product [Clonostachys chloroleuca]
MDATARDHASETSPTDIILSFIITTLIIVSLLLGYYILAFDPELDPFRSKDERSKKCQFPNSIDVVVLGLVRSIPDLVKLPSFSVVKTEELEAALNSCVLTFFDTQVFAGTAALFCALRELERGLQVYHLDIVARLGWLAFITALSALSFLRNHLANYPAQRFWRITILSIMFGLLSFTVGLDGYFEIGQPKDPSTADSSPIQPWEPAIRYLGQKMPVNTPSFESMIMILIFMVWGFSIRLAKMSVNFDHKLREGALRLRQQSEKRQLGDGQTCNWDPLLCHTVGECVKVRLADPFLFAFFRVLHIHLDLFTSFLWEVGHFI